MLRVEGKAPTRVDLAGGTLDLWPIYNLIKEGATINVGVDLPASVTIKTHNDQTFSIVSVDQGASIIGDWNQLCTSADLPLLREVVVSLWTPELPGLDIKTEAMSPAGAGLGGSSCLAITLIACLHSLRAKITGESALPEDRLVSAAKNIESKIINAPTGCQDYLGAVRGALNVISYPPFGEKCETFPVDDVAPLTDQMILVYSGKSRASAINNWEIFKRIFDGDKQLLAKLLQIGTLAYQCGQAVSASCWQEALELSRQEWQRRIELWPAVETLETKKIAAAASKAGATLSRVCGAGGGGVMAVFAPKEAHNAVSMAVESVGGTVLRAGIAKYGLKVEINES